MSTISGFQAQESLQLLLRVQDHLLKLESKTSGKESKAHNHKVKMLTLLKKHLSGDLKDKQGIIDEINAATKENKRYNQGFFKSETDQIVKDTLKFLKNKPAQPSLKY